MAKSAVVDQDTDPYNVFMHSNFLNRTSSTSTIAGPNGPLPLSAFLVSVWKPLFYITELDWLKEGDEVFRNESFGHKTALSRISKEIMWSLLDHPRRTRNISEATYIFPDFETSFESNWPNYGRRDLNWVVRTDERKFSCVLVKKVMQTIEELEKKETPSHGIPRRFFILDSRGRCLINFCGDFGDRIVHLCSSADQRAFREGIDIGFPAPAVVDFKTQLADIEPKCRNATYLMTFKGQTKYQYSEVRRYLQKFNNDKDIKIVSKNGKRADENTTMTDPRVKEFADLMTNSQFGVAARGNNLFSYRLMEVLSGGAIPIVFSDNWVLPLREIVDWRETAVRLPEKKWEQTEEIIRMFSRDELCEWRKRVLSTYDRYFSSFPKVVNSIMMIVDRRMLSKYPSAFDNFTLY